MKIVIDTNVLLVSIGKQSPHRWLFDAILNGAVTVLVTNDILLEYQEIIAQQTDAIVAENIIKALTKLPNVEQCTIYYHWKLIEQDPDDDKFADCAVCGDADYLITHDKHFNVLKTIYFPTVKIITIFDFQKLMDKPM
jgi:uncharacterized protein